ncbi:sulfite exporter TauE/SafE family protein [Campylobacter sp.]|uniref:sulfite exporter TauE/SafE family protein n=1 Tax=Campylobacter sp. TaxID=205 RepID=UPI0026DD98CE|nr:sulfite exporter TauE/SafE family protein [Campylobacter sp.]MDO4673896.1 sulfite exporter TauE/SafE family protein [Campylobacter sp.]
MANDAFFYIFLGIFSGVASGLFGIGGGIIIMPSMFILGVNPHDAVVLSVIQMVFSSSFGTFIHYKNKKIDLKDGVFIGLGGFLGAGFSAIILNYISDLELICIFLCVSIIFFTQYAFNIRPKILVAKKILFAKNIILLFVGIFVGIFAISLGIGGGFLIGPILAYFLGYDSKKIASSSLLFVLFASLSGTISFFYFDILNFEILKKGILIGISSMIGVLMGIQFLNKINIKSHLKFLLSIYALSILTTSFSLLKKIL